MSTPVVTIQSITMEHPLYEQERTLRNEILLRPVGIADYGWEHNDPVSHHIVAICEQKVVGCVLLRPFPDGDTTRAQLSQMAVADSQQGQGIGGQMLTVLRKMAAALEVSSVFCHARHNAVNFYLKHGFEIYGDPFVEVGIEHRLMRTQTNLGPSDV